MSALRIYVPGDAAAVAVGADEVAAAIAAAAAARRRDRDRAQRLARPVLARAAGRGRDPRAASPTARSTPADVDGCSMRCSPAAAHPHCASACREDLPFLKRQTRLTFARCGIVDPRSLDDYRAHGGYKGSAALSLEPDGDRRGGHCSRACAAAAAPASRPGSSGGPSRRHAGADQKYIVCNADEGDSGTFADRMIMEGDPFVLIEGMTIAGIAVGATKGYIYIRSEYPHAIAAMDDAIAAARRGGMLGTGRRRLGLRLRHRSARRRRRLCLRRGDLAARKPGGQARRGARQAAAAGA